MVVNGYKIEELSDDVKTNELVLYGNFKNNDNTESNFKTTTTVDALLSLDSKEVADLLKAFGNFDRYKIIRLLLDGGKTANEIVKELDFKTTGKAYHHLNALVSLGLVFKYDDGRYHFHAKHIMGIMALLIGCNSYINKNRGDDHRIALKDLD